MCKHIILVSESSFFPICEAALPSNIPIVVESCADFKC